MVALPSKPFHWPGGIPTVIKADPNGDITRDEINEEAKGWLLFVEEKWVPRDNANVPDEDGDYEVRQRRSLVETWAKASQEFRDSYHQRAPTRDAIYGASRYPKNALENSHHSYDTPDLICLAPLGPSNPVNRSKWIKLNILAYRLDGEAGHCMNDMGFNHGSLDPNPTTVHDLSNVQLTDILPRALLEMANFEYIAMTRQGTVLYVRQIKNWFVVTQEDLDAGLITTVDFKYNGQVDIAVRRRAYNMCPVYQYLFIDRKCVEQVDNDGVGGKNWMNTDLDMTLPVIDILEGASKRDEFVFGFDGGRDGWEEDIGRIYAPGYLEMEAAGMEADYDHANLIEPDEAFGVRSSLPL
ncbi:hypothetical protein N7466_010599 [Penicillium verhagenii]|uniref:uncharacterized protein n=1 Tax=Penicillium verhagenii TaxID=1562060 RepID=UPI002544D974|nr:uncharacterized protein N7466_010599 [Penicillium verhagenii]KAJ5918607.1 hypothetical protein N7466_010599 [Penicillium verhagenii]